jgi:hypothetical protein
MDGGKEEGGREEKEDGDYASWDQIYHLIHLTLMLFRRNTTVRTRT